MSTPIAAGQVYRSCHPLDDISIRITHYRPGDARARIVDAATGKRFRQILVSQLHSTATTKTGLPRRTGYALTTQETT